MDRIVFERVHLTMFDFPGASEFACDFVLYVTNDNMDKTNKKSWCIFSINVYYIS